MNRNCSWITTPCPCDGADPAIPFHKVTSGIFPVHGVYYMEWVGLFHEHNNSIWSKEDGMKRMMQPGLRDEDIGVDREVTTIMHMMKK